MPEALYYDFERPWWGNPIVNGIGGGVASGGGGYVATGDPQTSGIVGVIGSIVTGGATYALTKGKVFDKSGNGNTGVLKNGAHIEDGKLVMRGGEEVVEVPDNPTLRLEASFSIVAKYTHRADPDQHAGIARKTPNVAYSKPGGGYMLAVHSDENTLVFTAGAGNGEKIVHRVEGRRPPLQRAGGDKGRGRLRQQNGVRRGERRRSGQRQVRQAGKSDHGTASNRTSPKGYQRFSGLRGPVQRGGEMTEEEPEKEEVREALRKLGHGW